MNIDGYIANAQFLTALTLIAFAFVVIVFRQRTSRQKPKPPSL
jgi:hypothetical protein